MFLRGGYDEKSWEMACNWLMMTSSGDNNWPRGSLGLLTDKTKKTEKANLEPRPPTAARLITDRLSSKEKVT